MGAAAALILLCLPAAAEVAVWSPNPLTGLFKGGDYAGMNDPSAAVRIHGALNGEFSGMVAVYSKEPVKLEPVAPVELKLQDGDAMIPASAMRIEYALPTGGEKGKKGRRFDGLRPEPSANDATHAAWITVKVPSDAKPGTYAGTLTVAGRQVPVTLTVAAWKLPDPKDFITHVGIVQSAESVALQYGKKYWSDEHFELIGKTFDHLARVGNKVIIIPLICKTNMGHSESMVRWIEKDGKLTHDFTLAEKYLDLYLERVGKPLAVIFYIYEPFLGGGHGSKKEVLDQGSLVTKLDPEKGELSIMEGPCLNHPTTKYLNYPQQLEEFWKPVFEGLRERLKARGLGDEHFMLGLNPDMHPGKNTMVNLKKIAPYARWSSQGHGKITNMRGTEVGYLTYVWGGKTPPDPSKQRYYGWKLKGQQCIFPRYGGNPWVLYPPLWSNAPLGIYRLIGEACLLANARGFGRLGADFWPVLPGKKKAAIIARYPKSNWSQCNLSTSVASVLEPGPDGALSTIRFETMREGIQEAEARIFIEKALTNEALKAKLGADLAAKCQEILDERVLRMRDAYAVGKDKNKGWDWYAAESGWQERTEKLFSTAARVAAAIGSN